MFLSKIKNFIKTNILEKYLYFKYYYVFNMSIDKTTRISSKALLDTTNPLGVHIGAYTMITANVTILTHDFVKQVHKNTYIGSNCFVGMNSVILAGITVGDNVIIAAGSIVTKNIPSNCVVAGNPAKIIRHDITTKKYGVLN